MRILLLALRNLTRNKRRTIITALAIIFGATAIVFLKGFVNGFVDMSVKISILARTAPIQVHRRGYFEADDPLKLNLPLDPKLVAQMKAVPGVTAVAPRVAFDGMVSNGNESAMFIATAIDPATEYEVCPKRRENVAEGSRPLAPGDRNKALIGKTLSESLGAKQGATLILQSAGPNAGGTNALDVEVSGFLPSRTIVESKRLVTVPLGLAQELLRMPDQVTEYVVGVADLERVDETAAQLQAALGAGYQVTTWKDIDSGMKTRIDVLRWVFFFVALVLFLLVATGIVNTMLMSVYERVREIGTMMAVGLRRRQVTALFLWEALALGLGGALAGAGAGWAIIHHLGARGILISPPGSDTPSWLHPFIETNFLALVVGFAVAGSVLSAFYPAWKASRLKPVDALRAN